MHTASLVHITPDAEELISYMARVSNPANQSNTETSGCLQARNAKLIKYLIQHQHWSPFEMVNMCVEINTTRAVAAQILRHRSFSFQEFSQRYADVSNGLGSPIMPSLRRQDKTNRQNSVDDLPVDRKEFYYRRINQLFVESEDLYRELVSNGVAKECARDVLPMASPSRLYMNGTIRSWLHYCDLRTSNGTQREHSLIANGVRDLLYTYLPIVSSAMWSKG
jgi:thymidylate synthase (FAD)